jgi:hypothetical protein
MDHREILNEEPAAALEPAEDAGAMVTAALRWQHHCAARWLISAVKEESVRAVICETHEDFLVLHEDGSLTAVSAKHRDVGQPRWTPGSLCSQGGVAHLFSFWNRAGERPLCCVMTSGALSPGDNGANELMRACSRGNGDDIKRWVPTMAQHLGGEEEVVTRFLSRLRIDHLLPGRDHVEAVNARQLMEPALRHLNLDPTRHVEAYRGLVDLIAERSGARPASGTDELARLARPEADWDMELRRARLAQRVITRQEALAQILDATVSSLPPLREAESPPPPTRMVRKLKAGRLSPTTQRSARRLRAGWYRLESQLRGVPQLQVEIDDLRTRAQAIAGDSQDHVGPLEPYGPEMLAELDRRLSVSALRRRYPFPLEDALLRGLVYQLTDECEVWWSSEESYENERLREISDGDFKLSDGDDSK